MRTQTIAVTGLTMALLSGAASSGMAQLISGWGLETGFQAATLTEGVPGSFTTTTPTGNAAPRALLPSTWSFANVGDSILLSGSVTLPNTLGNQQFRFGLFNSGSHNLGTLASGLWTSADAIGWEGYMVQIGNNGGADQVKGRDGATGAWLSNTGTYIVGGPSTSISPPPGTYSFSLGLTRTSATSVDITYSFVGGTVNRSGAYTDSVGASGDMTSFNTAGFLLNANTGAGTLSGVMVTTVPEPSAAALAGLGLVGLLGVARRKLS
jgi:hypothetical protein